MTCRISKLLPVLVFVLLSSCSNMARDTKLYIQTPSISPDNSEILFTDCRFEDGCRLAVYDLTSNTTRHLKTPPIYAAAHGSYSPDGRQIACILRKFGESKGVIGLVGRSGNVTRRFEKTIGYNRYPRFSKNGERIVYWNLLDSEIKRKYFVRHYANEVNIFAGYKRKYLHRPLYTPSAASYLPDRSGLIVSGTLLPGDEFFKKKYGENRIFVLDHDEPKFEPAFSYKSVMYDPQISTDGRRIVFVSSDLPYGPLKVSILENDQFSDLPIEGAFIRDLSISWDGTRIAFVVAEDATRYSGIWMFDLESEELRKLEP